MLTNVLKKITKRQPLTARDDSAGMHVRHGQHDERDDF